MNAEALRAAYTHGPGRVVEPGTSPRTAAPEGPRVPLTSLRGRFGAALARLLTDVATPLRWEPWNQYNDHRAYPSARAASTVDLVVEGRWLLDPVRRVLVGEGTPVIDGRCGSSWSAAAIVSRPDTASSVTCSRSWKSGTSRGRWSSTRHGSVSTRGCPG